MPVKEGFLTREQLSDRWQLSEQTLANWLHAGRGPRAVHFGGAVRYELREIARYEADPEGYEAAAKKPNTRRQRAGRK